MFSLSIGVRSSLNWINKLTFMELSLNVSFGLLDFKSICQYAHCRDFLFYIIIISSSTSSSSSSISERERESVRERGKRERKSGKRKKEKKKIRHI